MISATSGARSKSPFYVIENFLSPKQADSIVDALNINVPDEDSDGNPVYSQRFNHFGETVVFNQLELIKSKIEQYYGFSWLGTEEMSFEFYPEDCVNGYDPVCSNSMYIDKKWVRTERRDFVGVLFLSDYNDGSIEEFDDSFEVFGGKLQFPQHKFSFNPKRGTLVVFPAGPNFIHCISKVLAGDLFYVKFHIAAEQMWNYDIKQYPGDYKSWF